MQQTTSQQSMVGIYRRTNALASQIAQIRGERKWKMLERIIAAASQGDRAWPERPTKERQPRAMTRTSVPARKLLKLLAAQLDWHQIEVLHVLVEEEAKRIVEEPEE